MSTKSIQQKINEGGRINYKLLNQYLIDSEMTEAKSFDEVLPGYTMKYIRLEEDGSEKFVNGWICVENNFDYFLFKWWDYTIWSVQKEHIVKLYYKKYKESKKKELPIVFKKIVEENKYPVEINGVEVYRARDAYSMKRFMNTEKYKRALVSKFSVETK